MAKRQALGRGLSALLENAQTPTTPAAKSTFVEKSIGNVAGSIAMLSISQIETNPFQPRTNFDEVALRELATSIEKHGIIQPVTVRRTDDNSYQLISGERRFRASQIAGLKEIPAYIRDADDQSMLEMALVENIQRENLDAIEVAISYKRLIEECDLTQEQLSERVGKNRSTVSNYLRLLTLHAEVQIAIIEKKISMGHARALITIEDPDHQMEMLQKILKDDLSVRRTEAMVRTGAHKESTSLSSGAPLLSFEHQKVKADLRIKFGRGADLKKNDDGSGKIMLKFKSEDELQQILDALNL